MVYFNNDRVYFPSNDNIPEKAKLENPLFRIVQTLSEEDLYYYLEILEFTVRTED